MREKIGRTTAQTGTEYLDFAEKAKRDFERYKRWLHIDEQQLPGKMILDVGSANARFGDYVEKNYPDTKVISFDGRPEFGIQVDFLARAEQLPLRSESIDIALAHASISNNNGESTLAGLKELFRVLKPDGEIHVAPLFDVPLEFSQERLRLVREYVEELEREGVAKAQWINDGVEKRATQKYGELVETRYCLIIKKLL